MSRVFEAKCKDCGEKFFFTDTARTTDTARGLSPPERCPKHRDANAKGVRSVGAAYWNAPIETDDSKRCRGKYGLGRLVRHRDPPKEIVYHGVPVDLPLRVAASVKSPEDKEIHKRFKILAPTVAALVRALEDPNGPRVAVLVGPTGTGKSTWFPYCLLQSRVGQQGRICVTQPRTITLRQEQRDLEDDTTTPGFIAKRLLRAPDKGAGQEIGLQYSGEYTQRDRYTKLLFVTDGTVIRWLVSGEIAQFSVLIIDEAHEQSENMEQIFALLRYKLPLYPRLRIVIASATIAAKKFQEFFGQGNPSSVPIFEPPNAANHTNEHIHDRWPEDNDVGPGYARLLPAFTVPQTARECVQATAAIVSAIRTVPGFTQLKISRGDVLVFMPTMKLVESTVEAIRALALPALRVYPCHAKWLESEAEEYYASDSAIKLALSRKETPAIQRVIVATNYAETSVTITNLRYVIDSGYVTTPRWDAATRSTGIDPDERHTRAGCIQRKGRVGRQQDGECFRLYTKKNFDNLDEFPEHPRPEVARSPLDKFLLTAKACGIDDLSTYEWIGKSETPPAEIGRARAVLTERTTIDADGDITPAGVELERIQADSVDLSVFMADSDMHACALEVATFVAFVNLTGSPFGKDELALLGYHRWRTGCYDDLEFYLKVFHHWRQVKSKSQRQAWCREQGLSDKAMTAIADGASRNLQQFAERTHDRLDNRALEVAHLHRTRLVLARCMHDSTFVRSKSNQLIFSPLAENNPQLTAQIDQDSACAGVPGIDAFVCVSRRRDDRSVATVVARHIVRIDPSWLKVLPTAGPLQRARLIRQAITDGRSTFVDAVAVRIYAPPPALSVVSTSAAKGQVRDMHVVREGRSSDGNLILGVDSSTGAPLVLKTPRGSRQLLIPGSPMRGVVAEIDRSRGAVRLTQDGLNTEYVKTAGKEISARIVDVVPSPLFGQIAFVVLELEPGVEARLFPDRADFATWRNISEKSIGQLCLVMVLPATDQKSQEGGGDPRPKVETVAFGRGRRASVDDSLMLRGTIHSYRVDEKGQCTGLRYERKPGHMHSVDFGKLPDNWRQAAMKWQIGQWTDLVKPTPTSHFVLPKAMLDQNIKQFALGTPWNVTIGYLADKYAKAELAPGIRGIIPLGEMSWTWIANAGEIVSEGQRVLVKVVDVDYETYTVVLSLKQAIDSPLQVACKKYPVGTVIQGRVSRVETYGGFVSVDDGIDGLIHLSEMAWDWVGDPREHIAEGHTVVAKVIALEPDPRRTGHCRMQLSIKQLKPDPWSLYVAGDTVSAVVVEVQDRGVTVDCGDGVRGWIHISELAPRFVRHPSEEVSPGQAVQAKVIQIEGTGNRRQLKLSVKQAASTTHSSPVARPQSRPVYSERPISVPGTRRSEPRTSTTTRSTRVSEEDTGILGRLKKWFLG